MKKLWRKGLSLLLALCMVLSLCVVPGSPFASEAKAGDDEFYKIVHLDAGRKYYSPEVIKQYIDTMASSGFNQLQLYFSDNQGFRLALDDMVVTAKSGKTYDLTDALGNGYNQDYKSSHLNWYRPSLEPDGENYLTQAEMTDLIQYARKRGIEIVPCLNMPGHMGAILEILPDFRYASGSNVSMSSIDLENPDANEFALALLEKYVAYFQSQGCQYFNIGGDEYAYDIGNDISICNSATYTDYIVPFMNNCAEIIMSHDMTPRAFNDFFGWNKDAMVTNDFQICYWADIANGGGLKHISDLISMDYDKFINTNENWYFAVGSAYYTLDSTTAGVNTADPYVFCSKNGHPETYENGLGAMFCIWGDRGRLDDATNNTNVDADGRTTHTNYSSRTEPAGGDGGQTVYELSKPFIEIMGTKLPKTPIVFHLDQGEDYVLGRFEGKKTAEEWAETLGLTGNAVLDVTAEHVQTAVPNEIAEKPLNAFKNGDLVVVSNGTYYLTLKGEELSATTDPEKATIWTSDGKLLSANGLYLVGDPGYGGHDELVATAKPDGCGWKVVNSDNVLQTTNYGNKYLTLNENGAGASSTPSGVSAYKVVPGVPDLTEVAVVGKAEGTATFTYNEVEYTIVVGNAVIPQCSHENVEHHDRVEPTIEEYGYEEYWECSDCGKLFKDVECTQKTTLNALRIDKLPQPEHEHALTYHPVKEATTTETGVAKEYWECTGEKQGEVATFALEPEGCGKFFADEAATIEIDAATLASEYIIPMVEELPGEHTVNVTMGGTHTCDKCVVTSVGTDLGLRDGSVGDADGNEIATYTVKVESKTDTVGGGENITVGEVISKEALDAMAVGQSIECIFGNAAKTNYITTATGGHGEVSAAVKWVITKETNGFSIKVAGTDNYLQHGGMGDALKIASEKAIWQYTGTQIGYDNFYIAMWNYDDWFTLYAGGTDKALPYAVASSGGSEGEKVTTYTYTFTFTGVAAGSADLIASDTTFHVNVNDPSICEHTGGTATCQNKATCEKCGAEYGEIDSDNHEHFTPANCVEKAHCTDCDKDFGEVDPTNHKGPTETKYPNGFDSSNYTGDIYCTACDMLIKQGSSIDPNHEVIHMYEDEELEFFVPCGDQALDLNTTGMDESVVVSVEADFQAFVSGKQKERVTDISTIQNETEMIVTNGTLYLKATEKPDGSFELKTTDQEDEATKFLVYKSGRNDENGPEGNKVPMFSLVYKGQALRTPGDNFGDKLVMAVPDWGKHNWCIDAQGNLRVDTYPRANIVLDDGDPRVCASGETSTVGVYTPNTNTPSGMNVKITAGAEGQTTFKLGQNTYTIIVEPVVLEGQKVTVDYFITNQWTGYNGDEAPTVHSMDITAADPYVNTPDGILLEGLVPHDIMHKGFKTVYWKGTKHPADNMQYDMNHTGGNGALDVTKSKDTVDFKHIRFWGGHWSVSWDGKTWTKLDDGDQLVARYLLQTTVTEEVTTEVQDWGEVAYSNTYRVLLDFAVKYASGDVRPDPNAYFIPGKSIFYHAIPGQDKVEDVNGVSHRRIDTIIGRETSDREVYMITLTPTSDDYTKRLENTQMGEGGKYTYDGTEKIVWLATARENYNTELTFHPDFQWGETPSAEDMDAFDENNPDAVLPEGYVDWKEIGNTGGVPYVDQVKIYDHQGMLVTYYIRAKENTEDNKDQLTVHYLEWKGDNAEAEQFHKYGIVVNEGTVFDEGFARDDNDADYGLTHNNVMNDLDFEQWVNSHLDEVPGIPPQYRTGEYSLYMVKRSTGDDLNTTDVVEGVGTDVYLYYYKNSMDRYVVADFGLPMNITWEDVLKGELAGDFKSMEYMTSGTDEAGNPYINEQLKYGKLTEGALNPAGVQNYIYTPDKVMTGRENTIYLQVMLQVNVETEGVVTSQLVPKTIKVHIVPATTVYYEPVQNDNINFVEFSGVSTENDPTWAVNGQYPGTAVQDTFAVAKEKNPYGYDTYYKELAGPSANYEAVAKVSGQSAAEFTFTGTGVEVYANCTKNTGKIMLVLSKHKADDTKETVRVISVDTKIGAGKTDGTNFQNWDNTYNVPVVSLNGLDFGEYTVKVMYYTTRGDVRVDGIHIDGFRVTRPVDDQISRTVYVQNSEARPTFVEVRDKVLAKVGLPNNWEEDSEYADQIAKDIWNQVNALEATEGIAKAVVVDSITGLGSNTDDEIKLEILDKGPKNELYLKPGQSLLMSVDAKYNYQVGLKALNGTAIFKDNIDSTADGITVKSATDMYYRVVTTEQTVDGKTTAQIVITNTAQPNENTVDGIMTAGNILVISKLKALPKVQTSDAPQSPTEQVFVPFTEASFTTALLSLADFTTEEPDTNAWDAAATYVKGDVVTYNGKSYEAKWWTQGEEPGANNWGAWKEIKKPVETPEESVIAEWDAKTAYEKGAEVIYNGKTYEAKWWTQGEEPGVNKWGAWKEQNPNKNKNKK